jgi:GntR family transcriptional regulator
LAIRPEENALESETGPADGRPLYSRVRFALCERIRSGIWRPGQMIPSEAGIGRELGVSQGTVRKALDSLAREQLVVRRQGRGTFVVEHTPDDVLFRFFQIYEDNGARIRPESMSTRASVMEASPPQRQRLGLPKGARVIRIERQRLRGGVPFVAETIVLPKSRFPGLARRTGIPNTLYDLFQSEYGILVARADERLTAIATDKRTARALQLPPGAPLLRIDRLAFALDDRPIEWRVSLVHLDGIHYLARLR